MKRAVILLGGLFLLGGAFAQKRELIPYGDFQNWLKRDIKESVILGGQEKRVYAIAPQGHIVGNKAYKRGVSPWSTSNVYANVMGIAKTSNTVFPEDRGGGKMCARMESMMVTCKALGVVNITIMVAGTVFLGETIEPIKDADDPYSKLDMGIEFTKRPKALIYDYYTSMSLNNTITTAKGWSVKTAPGEDCAQVFVVLQNRTEAPDGTITAKRVATGKEYLEKSSYSWVNDHKMNIHYGDISKESFYKSYMGLNDRYFAKNSNGKMVKVVENGWADKDEAVTHAVVFFSSSKYEAFVGAVGNIFKIDNVRFEY